MGVLREKKVKLDKLTGENGVRIIFPRKIILTPKLLDKRLTKQEIMLNLTSSILKARALRG